MKKIFLKLIERLFGVLILREGNHKTVFFDTAGHKWRNVQSGQRFGRKAFAV